MAVTEKTNGETSSLLGKDLLWICKKVHVKELADPGRIVVTLWMSLPDVGPWRLVSLEVRRYVIARGLVWG